MKLKAHKKKAMTLIEILISLALIAILLVPIANVVISTSNTSKRAEAKQQGSLIGENILEEIKAIDTVAGDGKYKLLDGNDILFSNTDIEETTSFSLKDSKKKKYSVEVKTERMYEYGDGLSNNLAGNIGVTGPKWTDNGKFSCAIKLVQRSDGTIDLVNGNGDLRGNLKGKQNLMLQIRKSGSNIICDFFETSDGVNPIGTSLGTIQEQATTNTGTDKGILILLGTGVKDKLNVSVDSDYDGLIKVDVTKEQNVDGDMTITPRKLKSTFSKANYASPGKGTQLGDLYKVTVEVKYDKETVFTATATNNIKR